MSRKFKTYKPRCDECCYSKIYNGEPDAEGECRHDTPYYWKIIRKDDWCGHHKSME